MTDLTRYVILVLSLTRGIKMLDKKQLANFRTRIKKDQKSFGAMGAMMLAIEFQGMSKEQLTQLNEYLVNSKVPVNYEPLQKLLN